MATKLNRNHKKALRSSSRQALQKAFASLRRHMHRGRWIGDNNRYRENCTRFLSKDTRPTSYNISDTHLAQYIAASAPLHCADGWSFLGRALECHAQGDNDAARHFGYYSELRAAMSLLAVEGIGIFDDRHFVVDGSGICQLVKGPRTHNIAWLALEYWANLKRSTDLIARIIRPNGIPLEDWLGAFGVALHAGDLWRPIGSKWLKSWGLDLHQLADDRDARNISSYRPTRLSPLQPLDASSAVHFMCDLWEICDELTPQSPFENLDRHLLRRSLRLGFRAITGQTAESDPIGFEASISSLLGVIGIDEPYKQKWRLFLTQTRFNDLAIITKAQQVTQVSHPHHHMQVLARAALLLRVATGACAQLIYESGFSVEDLKFWWKPLGENHGFWEPGGEPADLRDLWADVETALSNTLRWENSNSAANISYARWQRELSYETAILGGCERIALWGLGL